MNTLDLHMSVEDPLSEHSLYLDNNTEYGKIILGRKESGTHI